jgi:glycosyltransferase involved in cell wall biosynthesis
MRILLITDPGILVPPMGYGGIERIVADLAVEYLHRGYEVDILTTKGSIIDQCRIFSLGEEGFPPTKKVMYMSILKSWVFLLKNKNQYDLIQNFGRLLYLAPIINAQTKKIQCYQREISARNISHVLKFKNRNLAFSGCSRNLIHRVNPKGNWNAIHNCVVFKKYQLNESVSEDAPLIFLGRIERIKGCHTAIQVANASGKKLLIAGNISKNSDEKNYFETEIQPYIDGETIQFMGEVNDEQKNELLGQSLALVMPIEWEEPFGIVMIEAMACGTPVIAFSIGSVPEVIDESITGHIVFNQKEMIDAIGNVHLINREKCRAMAVNRFDVSEVAQKYLNIFE